MHLIVCAGLIVWETLDFEQVEKLVNGIDIGVPIVETKSEDKEKVLGASDSDSHSKPDSKKEDSDEDKIIKKSDESDDPVIA